MGKQKKSFNIKQLMPDRHINRLLLIMAVWLIFMAITVGNKFYSLLNFQTMFAQFPEIGLLSLGVMVCMITGGIDLSTVAVANISAIIAALTMRSMADAEGNISSIWIVIVFLMAIVIGAIAGVFNGILISKLNIPPILATLGSSNLFTGIGIVITKGAAISDFSKQYSYTINNRIAGIPVQFMIFVVVAIVIGFLLVKTTYGKKILLVGTSQNVARYSGLNVDRILIKTYFISGISAALGGMVMLANYNSARAEYGSNYMLQSILVVVLGGVNPNGGRGKISGVLLAILLVRFLETGINRFPQISSYYISLIWGAVLLLVMVMNYFHEQRAKVSR